MTKPMHATYHVTDKVHRKYYKNTVKLWKYMWSATSMSLQGLCDSEIHEYTGISVQSLKQLQSTHCQTGEVSCKPVVPGWPHDLTTMHRKVYPKVSQIIFISQSTVPLWLHEMPAWPSPQGVADRTLWGLWHGDVGANNCAHPPKGGLHYENSVSFCLFCQHSHINCVDHTACSGAKWAGLSRVQDSYLYPLPPWTVSFCWWKSLQLVDIEEAIHMVFAWWMHNSVQISISQNKIFHPPSHLPWWYPPPGGHWESYHQCRLPPFHSGLASTHEQVAPPQFCAHVTTCTIFF